ncbi:hypothetical protein, partial [Paludibacterium sp.]|uniref:hypothetical protein n=1 Tax=Paludibacterium sp. TaxID=1917523 RepID=UPI0025F8A827
MVLTNDSRLAFIVAGTKKKSSEMGTGHAINFCHATEMSSWGDEDAVANLMATFAEENPHRLYIFESTARGYDNPLPEMWEEAKRSDFQRAIFVGWWRNEMYSKHKDSAEYAIYWDGYLTTDEKVWVEEIKELYDFDITSEQIAWWRYTLEEKMKGDELRMYQEFPPTEDYAFQLTGSKFFSSAHISKDFKQIKDLEGRYYCYQMGQYFEFTSFYETNEENADLTIWEGYEPGEHIYVIGADPAYGSSDWADRFVASVWKCYADRVEQVAEYCSTDCNTYQFAWVLAHLCGEYGGALLNLEITGPGQAVFNELRNLAQMGGAPNHPADIYDIVGSVRHYFYKRQDSISSAYAFQWQTNQREKERLFNTYRDYYERGFLVIRSCELLKEMRTIVRDGGSINGEGTAKDDRVMGAGLSVIAWNDFVMNGLIQQGVTWELCQKEKEYGKTATLGSLLTRAMIENALRNPLDD